MRKINWGLIGCGDIARKRVAPALRDLENCQLLAVCRADSSKAEAFAHEFAAKRWYAHWQDLIADPDIDAVYVATPVYLHAQQTIAAAKHGKHVLCEKPMAMDTVECEQMIAACHAHKVKLGIAYYRHFYPVINRIKELIHSHTLGDVVMVQINAFEYFDRKPGEPRHWLLQKELAGGGPMMDFGCHRLEVLLNLLGTVKAVKSLTVNNRIKGRTVEDTATALLHFVSGGLGMVSVTHASMISRDSVEIYCTGGMMQVPVLNEGALIIRDADGEKIEKHPPHSNFHLPQIENFARAVLDDFTPSVAGEQGREVNRILDMIYQHQHTPDV